MDKDKKDSEELEDPKESEVLKPDADEPDPLDDEEEVDSDTPDTDDPFEEEETQPEAVEQEVEPVTRQVDPDKIGVEKDDDFSEFGPIKRPTPSVSQDYAPRREEVSMSWGQPLKPQTNSSNKKTILLIIIFLLMLVGGFFLLRGSGIVKNLGFAPSPSPSAEPTTAPASGPEVPKQALDRSEWSFEVLNGSGQTGLAKKIADQIKELGYPVVKVGNAENQDFEKTEILVKSDLTERVEVVIADLKDIVKVASYGGELKEGTASARIILGKDIL